MKPVIIALKIVAGLILIGYVVLPIVTWIDSWASGATTSFTWMFWTGLGVSGMLLLTAYEIEGRIKKRNEKQIELGD